MKNKFQGRTGKLLLIGLGGMLLYAELGPLGLVLLAVVVMMVD